MMIQRPAHTFGQSVELVISIIKKKDNLIGSYQIALFFVTYLALFVFFLLKIYSATTNKQIKA
jgi:hypothetical protein